MILFCMSRRKFEEVSYDSDEIVVLLAELLDCDGCSRRK